MDIINYSFFNLSLKEIRYIFASIIFVLVAISNMIVIYFFQKREKVYKKEILILGLIAYNIGFCFTAVNYLIRKKYFPIARIFDFIAFISVGVLIISLFYFFLNYPVNRFRRWWKTVFFILLGQEIFSCIITFLDYFYLSKWIIDTEFRQSLHRIIILFGSWKEIPYFIALGIIFVKNVKEYKYKIEGTISKYFIKFFLVTFLIEFLGFSLVVTFLIEPFKLFLPLRYALIGFIVNWGILLGVFGFKFTEKYRVFSKIAVEMAKILLLFIISYSILMPLNLDIFLVPITVFTIFYYSFEYIKSLILRLIQIDYEKSISIINTAHTIESFEYLLKKELKEVLAINNTKIIIENKDELKRYSYTKDKIITIEDNSKFVSGVKIFFNNKLLGIILIANKENGKMFMRKDIEFLINLSNEISFTLHSLMMQKLKNDIFKREEFDLSDQNGEIIMYNREFAKKILEISEDEEVKKYAKYIIEGGDSKDEI